MELEFTPVTAVRRVRGRRPRLPPASPTTRACRSRSRSIPPCRASIVSDQQRLGQVLREPALERVQVHPRRRGQAVDRLSSGRKRPGSGAAAQRRPGDRVLGHRHRRRHPRRQAEPDLRGLPAGGRHDRAQVRRDRPGPVDLRARSPACSAARSRSNRCSGWAAGSRCSCRPPSPTPNPDPSRPPRALVHPAATHRATRSTTTAPA